MSDTALSFEDFRQVLVEAQSLTDAAEAHGTLVGALCTTECSLSDWLSEILPASTSPLVTSNLQRVFEATRVSLSDIGMSFAPLLPDDEVSLDLRTAALGEWCQGFLYGLGSGPAAGAADFRGETAEVLQDLTEITRVDVDATEDAETNEAAFTELVEYVRVSVQLVYAQLHSMRGPAVSAPEPVLH